MSDMCDMSGHNMSKYISQAPSNQSSSPVKTGYKFSSVVRKILTSILFGFIEFQVRFLACPWVAVVFSKDVILEEDIESWVETESSL